MQVNLPQILVRIHFSFLIQPTRKCKRFRPSENREKSRDEICLQVPFRKMSAWPPLRQPGVTSAWAPSAPECVHCVLPPPNPALELGFWISDSPVRLPPLGQHCPKQDVNKIRPKCERIYPWACSHFCSRLTGGLHKRRSWALGGSVARSRPMLCNPIDWSTPGSPVLLCLPEVAQTHEPCEWDFIWRRGLRRCD